MELLDKLAILADAAKYDASCASSGTEKRDSRGAKGGIGSTEGMGICHAYAPDGRCISLLKILLTNACIYDCLYCINRRSSNTKRARFSVAEIVQLTLGFYRRNCIEGLFLSSGIIRNPDYTMEQVVAVARILREEHGFRGYIHLKTIPDADPALLAEAGRYADRLSINVELPSEGALSRLAPEKDLSGIRRSMGRMRLRIDEARAEKGAPRFAPAGQSTQVIVGADPSPDRQILAMSRNLYGSYGLRRVYYSAFSPIPDASTALPPKPAPLVREHRLYQADWLMRFYGFDAEEITTGADGNLDLAIDPKTAWALAHREFFPVDTNRAPREALLRVPGLGVKSVDRIIQARRHRRLRAEDLARIGVPLRRAAPFLTMTDHTPGALLDSAGLAARVRPPAQADLFRLMRGIVLAGETDWEGWRNAARTLALEGVPPEGVVWSVQANDDLFGESPPAAAASGALTLPRALVELAETVILAKDPERFALLYRLIWRAHRGEKHLLEDAADPEVLRAKRLGHAVSRDMHKMRAFLRFREVPEGDGTRHVAWFEPEHYIVEANAGFFARRFATLRWSILTPWRSAHWDGETLAFGPGATRAEVPPDDALAEYWRTYFTSIFNPARLKVAAMRNEMPRRYWRNLPEAEAIPELIRTAPARAARMVEQELTSAPRPVRRPPPAHKAGHEEVQPGTHATPDTPLARARAEAKTCKACPLYTDATQTVFGEGPADARIMLVGEQPGDQEDLAGKPFVGPAGQMLDRALAEAGLDRSKVYVTNAVKHFKFTPRGKRRIHSKPDASEIAACRFWLDLERREVQPAITVLLGASAARSVLGRTVTISRERGVPIPMEGNTQAFVTVHPSYLLRLPDEESRHREYAAFVADLKKVVALAA